MAFDPADPTEDDLRSASRLSVARTYDQLLEAGYEEEARELRNRTRTGISSEYHRLALQYRRRLLAEW